MDILPKGWRRIESIDKPGLSCGKIKVKYYSPNGKCFKTKSQMQKYLGEIVDLSYFDFNTGKINPYLVRKNSKKSKVKSLIQPVRQFHPTLKNDITVVKTQPGSKVNNDLKPVTTDKPRQIFWEKRINFKLMEKETDDLQLGKILKPVGPQIDYNDALRSVTSALFINGNGIVGQTDARFFEKNQCVFVNSDQPLISALIITEEDIKRQEEKVRNARKKLELAIKKN